jgi:hypothetical protein
VSCNSAQHVDCICVGRTLEAIGSPFTILLPLEDRLALECTAELRGMSTNALALAIVRTVVREQLIDAVLDAGEAVANDGIG